MSAPIRLLHALFPFWGLFWLTLALTGSGLWLHWREPWSGLGWGGVEMLHVLLGLVASVGLLGYLVHHLVRHWGDFTEFQRVLGLVLAVDLLLVTLTGLWLELMMSGPPPEWVIPVHFWTTFPILPLIVLHTAQYVRRWMASRA